MPERQKCSVPGIQQAYVYANIPSSDIFIRSLSFRSVVSCFWSFHKGTMKTLAENYGQDEKTKCKIQRCEEWCQEERKFDTQEALEIDGENGH